MAPAASLLPSFVLEVYFLVEPKKPSPRKQNQNGLTSPVRVRDANRDGYAIL